MEIQEGIQPEVVAQMQALARVIDEVINEKAVSQKTGGLRSWSFRSTRLSKAE